MAVIRLQIDIDSEVYPELYASLRGIERPESREERLRQLAGSGLVWEAVRMHGPTAIAMPPVVAAGKKTPPSRQPPASPQPARPAGAPSAKEAAALPGPAAASRPVPPETMGPVAPVRPAAPEEGLPPASRSRNRPPEPGKVPVLMDVVDEVVSGPVPLDETVRREAPPPAEPPPELPPMDNSVHRPSSRSARLKRMADRGLFKNG